MRERTTADGLAPSEAEAAEPTHGVLEPLLRLTEQLSAASSHDDVARVVADGVVDAFGASAGFVAVETADRRALEMLSHVRVDQPSTALCRLEGDANLPVVEAWRFGVPVLAPTAEALYGRYPQMDRSRSDRVALAALPLEVDGERLGALNVTFPVAQPFDEVQQRSLRAFASLCAQALRRVQLAGEVERMRQEFVVTASHELRSPLTAVYGAAVALASDMPIRDSSRAELLHIIASQSERMKRVVDDLSLTADIEGGDIKCRTERVDIADVLDGVIGFWERQPGDQGRVLIQLEAPLPFAMADGPRLQQVMSHLVDNACRYSPPASPVVVQAQRSPDGVLLRVLDRGPGMQPRDLARAFDKFFRADPMQRNGVGGTGLGLYVCRRLVDAMGGRIWIEPRPGGGLAACVELTAWVD